MKCNKEYTYKETLPPPPPKKEKKIKYIKTGGRLQVNYCLLISLAG